MRTKKHLAFAAFASALCALGISAFAAQAERYASVPVETSDHDGGHGHVALSHDGGHGH